MTLHAARSTKELESTQRVQTSRAAVILVDSRHHAILSVGEWRPLVRINTQFDTAQCSMTRGSKHYMHLLLNQVKEPWIDPDPGPNHR